MSGKMTSLMAGYQPCPVVFDTPKRKSFAIQRFKGFREAIRLLWRARQNRAHLKAEEAYNEAIRFHSIGRFKEAEKFYGVCLKLQTDHEPAYTNLAALYIERNNTDLAIEELCKVIDCRPNFFRGYYNLGLVYQMLGRWKDAVNMLEQAVALNPTHFWSYMTLGEIYASREEYEKAISYYEEALQHTDQNQAVYIRLAEFYVHAHGYEKSEEYLRQALRIKPMPEIYYNLGWVLATQEKEPEEVVAMFSGAEKRKKNFEQALFNLALSQSLLNQNEDSVENMIRYTNRYVKKDDKERIKYLEYLREVNPDNYLAMLTIAELHQEAAQTEKAIEVLKALLAAKPNFTPGVEKLADVYRNMGRYKDSIRTYRALIHYEPKNIKGYLGLIKAYGGVENYGAALPVVKKLLELDPNNTQIHYQYGTLMAQQNKLSLAFKHYRIVASLDPHFPRIQTRLKMLEEEMEDQSEETRLGIQSSGFQRGKS